jgi:hypothetical protein
MAQLSVIVESIIKAYTGFDVRNYGYEKARDCFQASFKDILKLTDEKKNSYFLSFKVKEDVRIVVDVKKEEKKAMPKKQGPKKEVKQRESKKKKVPMKPKRENTKPVEVVKTIMDDDLSI